MTRIIMMTADKISEDLPDQRYQCAIKNGTQMTRIIMMTADKISEDLPDQRYQRAIKMEHI